MSNTDREAYLKEQKAHASDYVDGLLDVSAKLATVAEGEAQVRMSGALALIEDALPLQIAPNLSPTNHKAAVLLGKGFSFAEVERELDLEPGDIYQLHQQSPEFRKAKRYYEAVDEEEIGGVARQWMHIMLDREDLDDKVRASIMTLAQKTGMNVESKDMNRVDKLLRAEQIAATREIAHAPGRLVGVRETPVDADFEVVDASKD